MLRLMLPCRGSDKRELERRVQLLEECVGDEYPVGLEIWIHGMDEFYNPLILRKIKANLKEITGRMFLSIHGPIEIEKGSKRNFFQSEKDLKNLLKLIQLADEIGASLINIHVHSFLSYDELKERARKKDLESFKRTSIQRIKRDIQRLREVTSSQKICLENVAYSSTAGSVLDPQETIYELCFVEPKNILEIIDPEKNVFATIDICHLAQVYDSSQLLNQIQKLGRGLGHIHLSDLGNVWRPYISLAEEGVIPGNGRIGEKVFKELLGYLLGYTKTQDLGIVLEIKDESFIKPEESRESLKRVVRWLKELKRD